MREKIGEISPEMRRETFSRIHLFDSEKISGFWTKSLDITGKGIYTQVICLTDHFSLIRS